MNTTLANPGSQKLDQRAGKYLTFGLGNEEFAIQVMRVREIMGVHEITAVPETAGYVKGVLNLRGKVVPVVDLRLKFDLPEHQHTAHTCIIVAQIESRAGKLLMGIIVDGVSEVLSLAPADIEDTRWGAQTPHILGMAKIKNKVKILLDINMVFTAQEVERFADATG